MGYACIFYVWAVVHACILEWKSERRAWSSRSLELVGCVSVGESTLERQRTRLTGWWRMSIALLNAILLSMHNFLCLSSDFVKLRCDVRRWFMWVS